MKGRNGEGEGNRHKGGQGHRGREKQRGQVAPEIGGRPGTASSPALWDSVVSPTVRALSGRLRGGFAVAARLVSEDWDPAGRGRKLDPALQLPRPSERPRPRPARAQRTFRDLWGGG